MDVTEFGQLIRGLYFLFIIMLLLWSFVRWVIRYWEDNCYPRHHKHYHPKDDGIPWRRDVYTHKDQIIDKITVLRWDVPHVRLARMLRKLGGWYVEPYDGRLEKYKSVPYPANLTQSTNPAVLTLYAEIVHDGHANGEYWSAHGGNESLLKVLVEQFKTEKDWKDLIEDLSFWTDNQLWILMSAMLIVNDYYTEDAVEERANRRLWLATNVLLTAKARGLEEHFYDIYDELGEFFQYQPFVNRDVLMQFRDALLLHYAKDHSLIEITDKMIASAK